MSHSPSPKILLVADPRAASSEPSPAPVRRYRLARLRCEDRSPGGASRFEYLKRRFD